MPGLSTTALAVNGLVGGLVATIVMTVAMNAMGDEDDAPPTALLWRKYVGEADAPPTEYMMPGMALHFVYGVVAGGVLGVLGGVAALGLGPSCLVVSLVAGVVWALVLWIVAMAFWMNLVIGADADRETMVGMGVMHAVYGVVLGLSLGLIPGLV